MTLYPKPLAFLVLATLFGVGLGACTVALPALPSSTVVSSPTPTPVVMEQPAPAATSAATTTSKMRANYEFTATVDNQTALELVKSQAAVETKDYGAAGQFVTSINGLAGSNEYYWAFYVNEAYAEKGASQTILKKGDTIKFVYEAVTPSK